MLSLLRCPADAGNLTVLEPDGNRTAVANGTLRCATCAREFAVRDGIAVLMFGQPSHAETAREIQIRDARADAVLSKQRPEWRSAFSDATEMGPMLAALQPLGNNTVAELGCGTGRYTISLAGRGATVIAVDFSARSLALVRERLRPSPHIGLVQADVTAMHLAPRAYDRIVSTLHSNLPTREHRIACYRLAANALTDDGRFVFGTHHRGIRDLLLGIPGAGHYPETGIYRYRMRSAEVRREAKSFFGRVRVRQIQVLLPGLRYVWAARLASRLPVLRWFAGLLLAVADRPRRAD